MNGRHKAWWLGLGLALVAVVVALGAALLVRGEFASGSSTATVRIESGIVEPGGTDTVTLDVVNVDAPGVCVVTVDVDYDPAVKTATGCTPGSAAFDMKLCNPTYDANTVRFSGTKVTPLSGNLNLADITFDAVGAAGTTTALDVVVQTFTDCNGIPVAFVDQDGTNDIECQDADGDGVCNTDDLCSNTPSGAQVDVAGCSDAQVDADDDGVCNAGAPSDGPSDCDGSDLCAGTADGAQVDPSGCSDAQVDADDDGICSPGAPSTGPSDCQQTPADNCPNTPNPDQLDSPDHDGQGNVCDSDDDNDTVNDGSDNCPLLSNPNQLNTDGDPQGDACDPDDDNDTVLDGDDNCPVAANGDQLNTDGDSQGNACDSDDDNDGVSDSSEEFYGSDPLDDASKPEALGFSAASCSDGVDNDGDGHMDDDEGDGPDPGSAPDCKEAVTPTPTATATATATPTPTPGPDDDGDGLPNNLDPCPNDDDCDDDGLMDGAASSEDLNNNGVVDPGETDPESWDTDGDGLSDGLEEGLTTPEGDDTNTASPHWQTDADPSTQTDPLSADTDGDSIPDGLEDANQNGKMDAGETDAALVLTSLALGWSQTCYVGASATVDQALGSAGTKVLAVYRLGATQAFDRWFPGRPDVSTIETVAPYDQLFVLASEAVTWGQHFSGTSQGSAAMAQGWNAVCYSGATTDMDSATAGVADDINVIYALEADQSWERYAPGRPEVSDMTQCERLYGLLVLVTAEDGAIWIFNP